MLKENVGLSLMNPIENIDGKYLTFGVIDIPEEVRHSLSSEMSCRKCSSRDWLKVDTIPLFMALIDLNMGGTTLEGGKVKL